MSGPESCCLPARPRAWAIFATHFVLQNIAPPAECAGRQHRFGAYVHVLHAPFSNMFWGLMQIWWLGIAEPLYKEPELKLRPRYLSR
mgnify:CR=1 FL=1